MDILFPASLRREAAFFNVEGCWIAHARFAYDIVAAVRPELLVALGVGTEPYFTLCRSIKDNDIDSVCYAINDRLDDEGTNPGKATLEDLLWHSGECFDAFSYVLRMDFATACSQFSDDSIDLLFIDFSEADIAVFDIRGWLAKVRPGGIAVIHGIGLTNGSSLVNRCWSEMASRYDSFSFPHGSGLGVLKQADGSAAGPPCELFQRMFGNDAQSQQQLRDFYAIISKTDALSQEYKRLEFGKREARGFRT